MSQASGMFFIDLTSEPTYEQLYMDSTDVFLRLVILDACNHPNGMAAGAAMAGARDTICLKPQVCFFYLLFLYRSTNFVIFWSLGSLTHITPHILFHSPPQCTFNMCPHVPTH
jgi:hypothetical protein